MYNNINHKSRGNLKNKSYEFSVPGYISPNAIILTLPEVFALFSVSIHQNKLLLFVS